MGYEARNRQTSSGPSFFDTTERMAYNVLVDRLAPEMGLLAVLFGAMLRVQRPFWMLS